MSKNHELVIEHTSKDKVQAQQALRSRLAHLKECSIEWVSAHASELIGDGGKKMSFHEHSEHSLDLLAKGDGLDWIAGYIHGHWSSSDLLEFVYQMIKQEQFKIKSTPGWQRSLTSIFSKWVRSSFDQAYAFLKAHHDLSDRFFEVFLDENFLMYGPGFYLNPHATLEQAAQWQLQRCCEKLGILPSDKVLDAGSGWGGLGLYAAKNYGAHVTIVTHSEQQEKTIRAKAYLLQVDHLVTCLDRAKAFNPGTYDKIAFLTPMNLLGHHYLVNFLELISQSLKPQGLLVMQVITQGQEPFSVLYERFMQRYFFESFTASNLNQVIQTTTAVSKLKLLHLETMDDHAARSYADWYQRLVDGRDRLLDSGLTPSFLRLYDCYVALMYAGARSRCLQSTQLLLAGPEYTGPEWLLSHAKASYFPSPLVVTK